MAVNGTKNKGGKKNGKGLVPGIIAGGAAVLIYSLIFPLSRLAHYILAGVVAFIVGGAVKIMASGIDVSAKNTPKAAPEPEPEPAPNTGDSAADQLIMRGRDMIRAIDEENERIPDETLSARMDELNDLMGRIFQTVAEKPQKAPQIRRFMDYYLPTTLKMLQSYRVLNERGIAGSEAQDARHRIEDAMDVVIRATHKQLDTLYQDDMLDISTDIDVLEQMLRQDGLLNNGPSMDAARAAARSPHAPAAASQAGAAAQAEKPE